MIDRFEGEFAICEAQSGSTYQIPRAELPAGAREGDVLVATTNGRLKLDAEATRMRTERVRALHDRLFGNG